MEKGTFLELPDTTSDNLYPALFQCFTIILCGYIARRINIVSQSECKGIGTFVGTFALPSLIFLSLARLDFSIVNWTFLFAILLAKGVVFFLVIFITLLVSKPIHLGRAGIFAIFCTQSNDFALGYPIINAIYEKTHLEYTLYLYLMAPISLAILNPVAFIMMEINKQHELESNNQRKNELSKLHLAKQIIKGVAYNPVLVMTVLGIIGNFVFKHELPVYIEGLLEVLGQSFSSTALFLLGLRMVGQFHRLRGPALVLPFVLIMVKLIILPVVMRESVSLMKAGVNETDTLSLSTYAFLYGTIPTAPAVFVFSNLYQLEIDLMASSMVICTFVSAPMMFVSAKMISITKNYVEQLKNFGFHLSIVALVATLWVLMVFIVTKKYRRMPHRLTLCLIVSQILLSIFVVSGGPHPAYEPSWQTVVLQAFRIFNMYSCLLWTSMLAVGLLLLQSRGPCFVVTVWPVLGLVAWGAPAIMIIGLLATRAKLGTLDGKAADAIRLCLLIFCLTVTAGSLILYVRYRRRNAQIATLSAEVAGTSSPPDESSALVDNIEQISSTPSMSNGCYGTITTTPSPNNGCCSKDPHCEINTQTSDIEDMANKVNDCTCPPTMKDRCSTSVNQQCEYMEELDRTGGDLGLLPPEQTHGQQLLAHTVLIIVYTLCMFIGMTYTTWSMMMEDESGVFVEIEFLDIVANYGQGLIMFAIFGLNPEEIIIPAIRFIKKKLYGVELVLPAIEDLPFETKHVCEQFLTHHLERCKEAIAKDTRWRMRTYRNVFRGACLVRWLISCGLARDEIEAELYGKRLLDGRLIAHISNGYHFSNSQLLYNFK